MKQRTTALIVLGLLVVAPAVSASSLPGSTPARLIAPDVVELSLPESLGPLERPPVEFGHEKHSEALRSEGCVACHTIDESGFHPTLSAMAGVDEERDAVIDAYHAICTDCHRRLVEADRPAGPRTCGGCHVRFDLGISARAPISFDLSLHARHATAYPDDCAACHHVWDEALQRLVHVEKTEESCRSCHGSVVQDGTRTLRDAVHRDCVGCHLERALAGKEAGPSDCAGCHDRTRMAGIERLDEVPRLVRGQPDRGWVHRADATSPAVAFDHLAHESAVGSCSSCHHRTFKTCDTCHTLIGAAEGGGVTATEAHHRLSADHSCVGCHVRRTTSTGCAGCHAAHLRAPAATGCAVCHSGPRPGEELPETPPMPAEAELGTLPEVSDAFPETVVIDRLADAYQASTLPHAKIVARLDGFVRDDGVAARFHRGSATLCAGCHHHTPIGDRPPPCRSCHATDGEPAGARPDLKVAYHQQCVGCHLAMDLPQRGCTDCHAEVES